MEFEIGDKVVVSGRIYQSANGTLSNKAIDKHIGVITKIAETAAHPYWVNGIQGWFNEDALIKYIAPSIKIGNKVKILKNITYSKKPFIPRYNEYEVLNIDDDKVTIGKNGIMITYMNMSNLQKVK